MAGSWQKIQGGCELKSAITDNMESFGQLERSSCQAAPVREPRRQLRNCEMPRSQSAKQAAPWQLVKPSKAISKWEVGNVVPAT